MTTLAVRRAEIRLRKAQAVLDEAKSEWTRRAWSVPGTFTPEEIEQARLRQIQAECDRDLARLDLEEAMGTP